MVGPINGAIGASYESIYPKMRFEEKSKFEVSTNAIILNCVVVTLDKKINKIKTIKKILR